MARKIAITKRIKQLRTQDKTGSQISTALRDEGYTLAETKNALLTAGYTLHMGRTRNHHAHMFISDKPLSPARAIATLYYRPQALPCVLWRIPAN